MMYCYRLVKIFAYGRGGYGAQTPQVVNGVYSSAPSSSSESGSLVSDASDDAISNLANDLNIKLDDSTKDSLLQYYLNSRTEKEKWDRQLDWSKNQYQYAVKDMVKAGINPIQALGALSGSSPGSTSANNSRGSAAELKIAGRDNLTKAGTSILTVLGIIAAAIVHAL